MKQALLIKGENPVISIDKEALVLRDELVGTALKLKKVTNKKEEDLAIEAASHLAAYRKNVEASRKLTKQPFLDKCREVDSLAEKLMEPVIQAEDRLKKGPHSLLGSYQMKLAEERREIEREAEKKRLESERIEREAEAARLAAEKKQTAMAEVKAERMEEKAVESRVAVMELKQQAEATKVRGGSMVWDYEVIDIHALYNEEPELVTLMTKRREILEHLKRLEDSGKPTGIPGLKTFKVPSIRIR